MAQKIFRVRVVTYKLCKQSAQALGGGMVRGSARNYEPVVGDVGGGRQRQRQMKNATLGNIYN